MYIKYRDGEQGQRESFLKIGQNAEKRKSRPLVRGAKPYGFGRAGRAWPEADYEGTDLETVLQDLLSGQYTNPIRVIAFNTAERWSEDVSEDVASEIRRRCDLQMHDVPSAIQDFVETHEGRRQLTLRLI